MTWRGAQTIGQFNRDRVAIDTTSLLEVGKLAHLHAVAPDLPTKPQAPRGAFPVILNKSNIVQLFINAQPIEALQIQILDL